MTTLFQPRRPRLPAFLLLAVALLAPFAGNRPAEASSRHDRSPQTQPQEVQPQQAQTRQAQTQQAQTQEPQSQEPQSQEPHSQEPHSQEPHSQEPHSQEPHSQEPHSQEPHSQEPQPEETRLPGTPASGGHLEGAEFYIETLTVEGLRHTSREIVLSESLLEEGRTYSEARLRDAVHRISRLPFVLEASFALQKGTVRDRYELVVTVVETRRWFFAAQAERTYFEEDSFDLGDTYTDRSVAGRRFFVGNHGVFFLALGDENGDFTLGYNHYNLFGRSVLLSTTYSRQLSEFELRRDAQRASLGLGIPLRTNQSLQISARYAYAGEDDNGLEFLVDRFFESGRDLSWEVEAAWNYNSLDDPVLPSSGLLVDAGLSYFEGESELRLVDRSQDPPLREDRDLVSEGLTLGLEARRHWELSPRHSISLGGQASFGSERSNQPRAKPPVLARESFDSWSAGADLGHAYFLLRNRKAERWRELRWESRLSHLGVDRSSRLFSASDREETHLGTGLVFRNGWGVFRFTLSYVWTYPDREP